MISFELQLLEPELVFSPALLRVGEIGAELPEGGLAITERESNLFQGTSHFVVLTM